jgi:hypothetical protein
MCELCGRLVLGLTGQDWAALPWMTNDARTTEAGMTTEVRGSCHVRCLIERAVASAWAEAVEGYHCARWPIFEEGRAGSVRWRLHCSPSARRLHLWRSDGRLSSFPYDAIGREPESVTADLAEVGSAHASVLMRAMGDGGARAPLSRVIAGLGLADRYPDDRGTVVRRVRNVGTVRRPEMLDVLVARHPLSLDPACRRAARRLVMGSVHGHER